MENPGIVNASVSQPANRQQRTFRAVALMVRANVRLNNNLRLRQAAAQAAAVPGHVVDAIVDGGQSGIEVVSEFGQNITDFVADEWTDLYKKQKKRQEDRHPGGEISEAALIVLTTSALAVKWSMAISFGVARMITAPLWLIHQSGRDIVNRLADVYHALTDIANILEKISR